MGMRRPWPIWTRTPARIRCYTETHYGAKSWHVDRRVAARIEATMQGLDIRYVVTSFSHGTAEWLYDSLYCARGQAENLINCTRASLLPTARVAVRLSPISCVSCCTPPPTGSC